MPGKKLKKQTRKLEALYERMNAEILVKLSAIESRPSRSAEVEKQLKELRDDVHHLKEFTTKQKREELRAYLTQLETAAVTTAESKAEQEDLSVTTSAILQGLGMPDIPKDTAKSQVAGVAFILANGSQLLST